MYSSFHKSYLHLAQSLETLLADLYNYIRDVFYIKKHNFYEYRIDHLKREVNPTTLLIHVQ